VIVLGPDLFGGKPGEMHDPPESIASAREVVTCRCRTDTWINSAKYQRQVRFKEIGKRLKQIGVSHE
jgi:hypothetical protein